MQQGELLYEGKAKQIFATDDPEIVLMAYKDEATAFDGTKRAIIKDKGIMNKRISCLLYQNLEKHGIKTHLVEEIDDRRVRVKKLAMIPLEVVIRNRIAGSLAQRLGREEGEVLKSPVVELYYKDDSLHDPLVNDFHARVLGWASSEQLEDIYRQALQTDAVLSELFARAEIILVDFKLEFGISQGEILLGDEISPDSCRLWDKDSLEKLDKDRFRRNLGGEEEAYREVVKRLERVLSK
jgi:phosphoribosylaminoimidazole-succinocarboxamide synthase